MRKEKIKEIVHYDEDGRKYYTLDVHDIGDMEKSRFWCPAEGLRFYDADPITEEEKLEAERLWNKIAMPGTSPGKKVEKKD